MPQKRGFHQSCAAETGSAAVLVSNAGNIASAFGRSLFTSMLSAISIVEVAAVAIVGCPDEKEHETTKILPLWYVRGSFVTFGIKLLTLESEQLRRGKGKH